MRYFLQIKASLAAMASLCTPVLANAASIDLQKAEKLHQLDIMLMFSAMRCQASGVDFTSAYDNFNAVHATELRDARKALTDDFASRFGTQSGQFAIDRLSTGIATRYGDGHPGLNCAELAEATRALAEDSMPGGLPAAAEWLLEEDPANMVIAAGY